MNNVSNRFLDRIGEKQRAEEVTKRDQEIRFLAIYSVLNEEDKQEIAEIMKKIIDARDPASVVLLHSPATRKV